MKDYSPIYQRLFFVIFWVTVLFGFISEEFFKELLPWRSTVFLVTDALWVILACLTVRRPLHVAVVGVFVVVTYVSTCFLNELSTVYWINGLRDFMGLVLAFPVVDYFMSDEERRVRFEMSLDRQLLYFLLVQAFCLPYQFMKYGAGDHGGGSMGNNFSGTMSMCIYIASFMLMRKRLDTERFFASLNDNKLLIFLLFPTFLNETKISFILIVMYFVLLLPLDRRYLVRAMWVMPILVMIAWVGASVYTTIVKSQGDDITSMEYLSEYLAGEDLDNIESGAQWDIDENNAADVPRIAKLLYLPLLHTQEPGHEALGFGVGQFKGGTTLEVSDFAYRYDWLLMGSIPYLFHVHIQLGLVGVALVLCWLLSLFVLKPSWSKGRDYNIQLFVAMLLFLIMLYNDSLRNLTFTMMLFSFFASSWLAQENNNQENIEE